MAAPRAAAGDGTGWAETERRVVVKAADVETLIVAIRAASARTLQPGVLM